MKRTAATFTVFLLGVLLASPILHGAADLDYVSFVDYIDSDRAWSIVDDLAGDRFEGRRAGTQGAELASEYITNYYSLIDLRPAGTDGTYRTKFTLPLWELVQMPSISLVDSSGNTEQSFEYRKDFFVMTGS